MPAGHRPVPENTVAAGTRGRHRVCDRHPDRQHHRRELDHGALPDARQARGARAAPLRRLAKLFADTVVTLEQTVTGAYRPTARFSRFKNVPERLQLFQLRADIRMGAELPELERLKPRLVGGDTPGKRIYRTATATPELLQFMERLAERVEHLGPPVKGARTICSKSPATLARPPSTCGSSCPAHPSTTQQAQPCRR